MHFSSYSILTLLAVLNSVFWIGMLVLGALIFRRNLMATRWPKVKATLLKCTILENPISDGNEYRVDVAYQYLVGSESFTGNTIYFGYSASTNKSRESQLVKKITEQGDRLQVHFAPRKPNISCMFPELCVFQFWLLVLPIVGWCFCTIILLIIGLAPGGVHHQGS